MKTSSDQPALQLNGGGARLAGELTLETVPGIYEDAGKALRRSGRRIRQVDLSDVSRVDSSGLALLLEWEAGSKQDGSVLEIRNAPSDLLRLARLCGAQELLNLDGRGGNDNGT